MVIYHSKCEQVFTLNSFLKSVNILLTKPHVINKRIWGNKILFRLLCNSFHKINSQYSCKRLDDASPEGIKQFAGDVLKALGLEEVKDNSVLDNIIEVVLTELLPKSYSVDRAYQLILVYKNEANVIFYDVTPENLQQNLCPNFSYTLMIENEDIVLNASCDEDSKIYQWLIKSFVQQFIKWGKEFDNNAVNQNICTESLALVSKNKYYHKYNELKLKYGKEMVKIWPECTDPVKFVYEDVAIATYLLLIWEEDKKSNIKKQTFVDLGCGNGLLVYILTKEGHNGIGIDVRKRQIWSMYSSDTLLEERTIVPSELSLFPEADWIIGNHSDELTPWIPVLAARSSYKCNFFVLPCCAYNFDGTKYQRKNSNKSQYVEYLEYIKSLSEECGFIVKIDRLKIPSTKRICLIGKTREYNINDFDNYCNKIQGIIQRDCGFHGDGMQDSMWIKDFKVRESHEKVRNCTQIDKKIIDTIVTKISTYLLEDYNEDSQWSLGKCIEIHKLIPLIPQEELKMLKSECGGLQTLLKNNHQIFKVQSGKVQLRYPKTIDEVDQSIKNRNKSISYKVQHKPCWFHNNHPQGCPLSDISCSYLHIKR